MITVYLTSIDHPRAYRAVASDADAISRIKTATVARFDPPASWAVDPSILDRTFAVCNGEGSHPKAAAEYRSSGGSGGLGCRSLSVGDLVHVPGYGIFSVDPMGFTRHDHRLVAAAAANALALSEGASS